MNAGWKSAYDASLCVRTVIPHNSYPMTRFFFEIFLNKTKIKKISLSSRPRKLSFTNIDQLVSASTTNENILAHWTWDARFFVFHFMVARQSPSELNLWQFLLRNPKNATTKISFLSADEVINRTFMIRRGFPFNVTKLREALRFRFERPQIVNRVSSSRGLEM